MNIFIVTRRERSTVSRMFWSAVGAVSLALALAPLASPAAVASENSHEATRVEVAGGTSGVATDRRTDTVYAAVGTDPGEVAVIDGVTNALTTLVKTAAGQPSGSPDDVAVDPATDRIYLAQLYPSSIAVIDGAKSTLAATISLGSDRPEGLAVDPKTDTLYAATYNESTDTGELLVISGRSDTVTTTIPVSVSDLAVDPQTDEVYATDGSDTVTVVAGRSNTVAATVTLPAGAEALGLAVDAAAGEVFVADVYPGEISVISTATNTVTDNFTGFDVPVAVAVGPGTRTLFVTARDAGQQGTTDVVDASTETITDSLPRGGISIAVDPETGTAYVAGDDVADSGMADYVSIIEPSASLLISPVIDNEPTAPFVTGQPGTFTYIVSDWPPGTITETGALPAGVSLTGGTLAGTPAAGTGGQYVFQVTASNGVAPADTETDVLTVDQPPAIGPTASGTTFQVGTPGSFAFTATGYPAPTFAAIGTLPAGVTMSGSGVLSGTPAAGTGGKYRVLISASNGVGSAATLPFTLVVD
jgi:DNA-binding beta-propeller fold protein YncE